MYNMVGPYRRIDININITQTVNIQYSINNGILINITNIKILQIESLIIIKFHFIYANITMMKIFK